MLEIKSYKAKFVDQISDKSHWAYSDFGEQIGHLYVRHDNRLQFIADGSCFTTSELQSDPVWRGNELIFVTLNSTYIFEIIEELEQAG